MRLLALALALAVGGGAGAAAAQGEAPAAHEKAKAPASAGAADRDRWGDGRALRDPRKEPARGEPYNWRQMGLGAAIMAVMLGFVLWLVRRQKRPAPPRA